MMEMAMALPVVFVGPGQLDLGKRCGGFSGWGSRRCRLVVAAPRLSKLVLKLRCSVEFPENGEASTSDEAFKIAQLDLNLPRRRLQAEFTCNACQTRTTRLINPHAYKRGTVFVQCSGCEVYHQLVDNLGLIVEFKYLEEKTD